MTLPLVMALVFAEDSWLAFWARWGPVPWRARGFLRYGHVRTKKLTMREGIAITGLGWLLATFLGMLPYCLGGYLNYFDGLFESISGFTGTGATVIPDLEILPQSLHFLAQPDPLARRTGYRRHLYRPAAGSGPVDGLHVQCRIDRAYAGTGPAQAP